MNTEKLREAVKKSGLTPTQIAAQCNLSTMGWYNKLNGKSDFKLSEVEIVCKALKLSSKERNDIFLR